MNKDSINNYLILLLAGNGSRMNLQNGLKKQFYMIENKPLFLYPLNSFIKSKIFKKYILVISKSDEETVKNYLKENNMKENIDLVIGGKTRDESVYNGLKYLSHFIKDNDKVFIHDSARALIDKDTIIKLKEESLNYDAITSVFKVYDSLFNNKENRYVNRDDYLKIATPQVFTYSIIKYCFDNLNFLSTDDYSKVLEYQKINKNIKTEVVEIPSITFKVTTIDDLKMLIALIKENKEYQI